jgi:hypothetical protein
MKLGLDHFLRDEERVAIEQIKEIDRRQQTEDKDGIAVRQDPLIGCNWIRHCHSLLSPMGQRRAKG